MPVVSGIDILSIQKYVFASNKLKDVLAASWMVDHVTKCDPSALLQWGMTNARVLLAAGGNAVVEFDNLEDAKTWTSHYTRWLQNEAPGLEVIASHRSYDGRSLAWGLKALAVELSQAKLERLPHAPQLGLSGTASCSVTGLPATSFDRHDGAPISRHVETLRRDDVQTRAKDRWNIYLPKELEHAEGWNAEFPLEIDLMGRSRGETSQLGIVHVDGNGVGAAIQDWLNRCFVANLDDERVRCEYSEWSAAIEQLGKQVLNSTVQRLASCIYDEDREHGGKQCGVLGTPRDLGFALSDWRDDKTCKTRKNTAFLPFRPILLGGDDLTFVCDGRIALDLAAAALRAFETCPVPHLGREGAAMKLTACGGVALVKAHAPFDRGYELAEKLSAAAKHSRRAENDKRNTETGSWLDWHVGSTRPSESLEALRTREYRGGDLTMRPYPLAEYSGREQSWTWLERKLLGPDQANDGSFRGFRERHERASPNAWSGSRNRVKQLGSLVCDDPLRIKEQVSAWNAIDNDLRLPANLHESGFVGTRTPLLDAIELFDLHVRLEPDPTERDGPGSLAHTSTREGRAR